MSEFRANLSKAQIAFLESGTTNTYHPGHLVTYGVNPATIEILKGLDLISLTDWHSPEEQQRLRQEAQEWAERGLTFLASTLDPKGPEQAAYCFRMAAQESQKSIAQVWRATPAGLALLSARGK